MFTRLQKADGTWDSFVANWSAQCDEVGEEFGEYGRDAMPVLEQFADGDDAEVWAVAITDDAGRYLGACTAQIARLPKTVGRTLRIRNVVACPLLDAGALSRDAYADMLIGLAWGAINLSSGDLAAKHVKFHLRSPGDMVYFRAFGNALDSRKVFESVDMHGAWLALTKHDSP